MGGPPFAAHAVGEINQGYDGCPGDVGRKPNDLRLGKGRIFFCVRVYVLIYPWCVHVCVCVSEALFAVVIKSHPS